MATHRRRSRVRGLWWLAILSCVAVPVRASADYRTNEIDGLRITIDSVWAPRAAPGYLPVRFDITNLVEDRVIEIIARGNRFLRGTRGGAASGSTIRQSVRLARGDRVRLTIPVPVFADSESYQFQIRENNRTLDSFSASTQSRIAAADASTLIVADPSKLFASQAIRWLRPVSGRTTVVTPSGTTTTGTVVLAPTAGGSSIDLMLDPTRLPGNWLGYTSLRAVFIGPSEWEQLSDPQRTALLTWIASGGDLVLVDGDISVLRLPPHSLAGVDQAPSLQRHFFGRVHVMSAAVIDADGMAVTLAALDGAQDAHRALPANTSPDWRASSVRGFRLTIPGIEGVPARAYLFILLVFSLLIGPVNYWLLRRKRQQILVVLTAPLISVIFIILLAGYAVAVEGFAVYGRAMTFTMLDQTSQHASTRATVSLYAAGMTPSGGLRFPKDVAVFLTGIDGLGSREDLRLDLTDAQQFAGGALSARSPSNLEQIAHRPARERLSFSRESGGIAVVNGLGARLDALLYRDGDKTYTLTQPLAAGAKSVLTTGTQSLLPADPAESSRFAIPISKLGSGSYLAVLDRSPFWESGVAGVVERGSFHLVLGSTDGGR